MDNKSVSVFSIIVITMTVLIMVLGIFFGIMIYESTRNKKTGDGKTVIIDDGFINIDVNDKDDALDVIESVDKKIGTNNARNELRYIGQEKTDNKDVYVMQQYYKDIPVYQRNVKLYVDGDQKTDRIESNYYKFNEDISTKETMSSDQAKKRVLSQYQNCEIKKEPQLVIYVESDEKPEELPFLSWVIIIRVYDSDKDDTIFIKMSDDDDVSDEDSQDTNYDWVIKPTIEADDIITANEGFEDYNKNSEYVERYGGFDTTRVAVIYNDEKYSFIKYNGKIISANGATGYCFMSPVHKFMLYTDNKDYTLSKDYTISDEPFGVEGVSMLYYWDEESSKCYCTFGHGSGASNTPTNITCPVAKCTIKEENDMTYCYPVENSKYAIYSKGKLITDFKYDYAYMAFDEITSIEKQYVIPYCMSDKWGYYNSDGKEILPCEYNASFKFMNTDFYQDDVNVPYLDSEGLLCVQNESGAGYVDLDGNVVIPLDEFEETRPVFNGFAWAKKDGKWGVIKLKNTDDSSDTDESKSESDRNKKNSDIDGSEDIDENNDRFESLNDHSIDEKPGYDTYDILRMIEGHYNDLLDDDGNYIIYDYECEEDDHGITAKLRYQMSEEELNYRMENGRETPANVYIEDLLVDKETGLVTPENSMTGFFVIEDDDPWYLW